METGEEKGFPTTPWRYPALQASAGQQLLNGTHGFRRQRPSMGSNLGLDHYFFQVSFFPPNFFFFKLWHNLPK